MRYNPLGVKPPFYELYEGPNHPAPFGHHRRVVRCGELGQGHRGESNFVAIAVTVNHETPIPYHPATIARYAFQPLLLPLVTNRDAC